ncbi:MAG: GxxExxY protein [bacterium]|nr:GxxExxY protein [bacterium]
MEINAITKEIIGSAIEVHRTLGPGLLESVYEECLCHELAIRNINFIRQNPLPIIYKNIHLDCGFRVDLLVENSVVIELKSVDKLLPIHEAQVLTYLKLGHWKVGLLINFNVTVLKDGIKRLIIEV